MTCTTLIRVASVFTARRHIFCWLACLVIGLSGTSALAATLRFPEITALTRESAADVRPGGSLTYRFTALAGTSRIKSVTLHFKGTTQATFRPIQTSAIESGVISATVPATWINDRYTLVGAIVVDEWQRAVTYSEDGSVSGGTAYPPGTHRLGLASLGFNLSEAYSGPLRAHLTTLTATNTEAVRPGDTVRFRYTVATGPVPLASISLHFGTLGNVAVVTIPNPQLAGEASLPISAQTTNGTYTLISITTTDQEGRIAHHNLNSNVVAESFLGTAGYYQPLVYFRESENYFHVVQARSFPPSSSVGVQITREGPETPGIGDTIRYRYTSTSTVFPLRSFQVLISGPYGATQTLVVEGTSGTFTIPVTSEWVTGPYFITTTGLTDTSGRIHNSSTVENPFNVRGIDLDPYFLRQPPVEVPVRAGFSAELIAQGIGLGPVSYQWYRGAPGDTRTPVTSEPPDSAVTRLNVTVAQPTTYWVRLTSAGQTADSRAAQVIPVDPPVITRQPASQAVPIGGTATFSVVAAGIGPFTYAWSGDNLPAGTQLDQPTLTIKGEGSRSSSMVRCHVSNIGGGTTSENAAFSVLDTDNPLRFTVEPSDAVMLPGSSSASFDSTATGTPPLRYRWQKDGVDIPRASGYTATSDPSGYRFRYNQDSVTPADTGVYRVIVENGFEIIYSREVRIRFVDAPVFVMQPPASLVSNGALLLEVSVLGAFPITYQWRKDGIPLAGETRNSINRVFPNNSVAGTYDVVVSNTYGSITSTPTQVSFRAPAPNPAIISPPASRTAQVGETVVFTVQSTGGERIEWLKGALTLQDGPTNTFTLPRVGSSDTEQYTVAIHGPSGTRSAGRSFLFSVPPTRDSPAVTRHPTDTTAPRGSIVRLGVASDGQTPFRYQWRRNGIPISEREGGSSVRQPDLIIRNFDSSWLGVYDVVVTNDFGSVTSQPARLSLPPPGTDGRLMNLSVRANAGGSHGPLIVGFVLGGGMSEEVPLLVRAAGPALSGFGVTGTLGNPFATLYRDTAPRFANDDWSGYPFVVATAARVGAFPFSTNDVRDAALAPSLAPGAYTVHITGSAGTSGVALAEIYDATPAAEINSTRPRLLNLSVQTRVTSDAPVIAGFVLGGVQPRKVLVRAIGPALAGFGVPGVLADPQLVLRNSDALVASNDDWAGDTSVRDAAAASGAFALSSPTSKDAALVATLVPGSYTAQVTGAAGASGLVLVEVYEVP